MLKNYTFSQGEKNPGIVTNMPSNSIYWSTGKNIRFKPGCLYKTPGKSLLATVPSGRATRGMFTFIDNSGVIRTIVCCDDKVYSYHDEFAEYDDITPSPAPTSDSSAIWQFTLVGGCPIITNGVDGVWQWKNFSSIMTKLTNAPLAKYLTTSHHRLMLGNIQEGAYTYPARIRWSGVVDPTLWAIDKTVKSGQADIVNMGYGLDTSEKIKSMLGVGEITYIFADRTNWYTHLSLKPYGYKLNIIPNSTGLLASRARVAVNGTVYLIGNDDFYTLNTSEQKSIGFPIKNSVFPNINKSASYLSYAFYQPVTNEVFFCLPMLDNKSLSPTPVNTAYIYNLELNNWTVCDVDYLAHTYNWTTDQIEWANSQGTWDSQLDKWDTVSNNGILPYNVVGNSSGQIFKLDSTYDNNGSAIEAYIETGDMNLSTKYVDASDLFKSIDSVYPSLKPQDIDTPLLIQVGVRDSLSDPVKWSAPVAYTIGISRKADFRHEGLWVRFRFYTSQIEDQWTLESFMSKYSYRGRR
jgi:hypothetical protein